MDRSRKLTLVALSLSNLSAFLAFSLIAPFFPKEAAAKGASDTAVGFVFGAFQLVIFIMSPIYGSLITKLGANYMYLAGSFICAVCIILFGFLDLCPDGNIYLVMCILCRLMDANGTAMMTTAIFAIAAHEFPNQMSLVLGILETCVGVGYMAGPLLGGSLYEVGGFKLPFIVVGSVLMLSAVLAFVLVPRVEGVRESKRFVGLFGVPNAVLAYALIVTAQYGMTSLDPTLAKDLLSVDSSLSTTAIGALFLVVPGTYSIAAPFVGRACDKGYTKVILVGGSLIFSASLLCLGPSPLLPMLPKRLWLTILSLAFLGFGMAGVWLPTFQLALSAAIKHGYKDGLDTHGMVAGLFNSGSALGAFVGPSSSGHVADVLGFGWMVTIGGGVLFLMALVTFISMLLDKWCSTIRQKSELQHDVQPDERTPLLGSVNTVLEGSA